nr:unnamed protein product [Digitaria exilis]
MEMEAPISSEGRWSRVASSLPVRNVQDLAECGEELKSETLQRYIQMDVPDCEVLVERSGEVPVIDLGRLLDPQFAEQEADRLRFACEDWGFFQLVNHGIPEEIITNVRSAIHKFFQLPLEVKNTYAQLPGDIQGYGQSYSVRTGQLKNTFTFPIMSNGKYKSIENRVTINANQERITVSAFHVPPLGGVISPVTGVTEEKILYKTMGVEEYAKLYLSNKLDGKRALDHAKLF